MRGHRKAYLDAHEPQLAEVLDDPVIQAVMTRDGVERHAIVDLALAVRARLQAPAKNSPCTACR